MVASHLLLEPLSQMPVAGLEHIEQLVRGTMAYQKLEPNCILCVAFNQSRDLVS